jgi:hypothetical protein
MKLLLDECPPLKLKDGLLGHDCHTVPEEGWAGKKNSELLSLAETRGFQIFLTLDRGLVSTELAGDAPSFCCGHNQVVWPAGYQKSRKSRKRFHEHSPARS